MRGFYAMKSTFKALFLALTMALFVLPAVSTNAADINNIPAPDYTLKYTVDKSDTFIYSCYEVTFVKSQFYKLSFSPDFNHICCLTVSEKSLILQSPALATLLFVDWLPTG